MKESLAWLMFTFLTMFISFFLFDWLITTARPRTLIPKVLDESVQKKNCYKNTVNADGKVHYDYIRNLAVNDDFIGTPIKNYI